MKKTALTLLTLLYLLSAFSQELEENLPNYTRNDILIGDEVKKAFRISSSDHLDGEIIYLSNVSLFKIDNDNRGYWRFDPSTEKGIYVLTLKYTLFHYFDAEEVILVKKYYVSVNSFYKRKIKRKIADTIHRTVSTETLELIPVKQ
jgi:hypothetical protein